MDERFGGRKRAIQHLGNLFVAQFVLPAEQYRSALVFRQAGQRFLDFLREFAVQQAFWSRDVRFILILLARLILVYDDDTAHEALTILREHFWSGEYTRWP